MKADARIWTVRVVAGPPDAEGDVADLESVKCTSNSIAEAKRAVRRVDRECPMWTLV